MGSCYTDKIYLSVLHPATVSIPRTIRSVSLLPVAGIPDPPGTFDSIRIAVLDPAYNYNLIKKGIIYGLYDVIATSPRFVKVVLTDSVTTGNADKGIISWDQLQEICRHDSTDAVLLLKKAVCYDTLMNGMTEIIYTGDGFDCNLFYKVVTRTRWAFYRPEDRLQTQTFYSVDSVFHYEEAGCYKIRSIQAMKELLYNACFFTGSAVGKKLVPVWDDQVARYLFTGPDKELREAAKLALANHWDEAGKIWYGLSDDGNKNLASRASFNMALAWEQDDDLNQAYLWISHADSLAGNHKTMDYRKVLKQRLKERTELDRQMSGE